MDEGEIEITQLSWDNPGGTSSWFVLAPVAGLLRNPATGLASLTFEVGIEQVSAQIGERKVPFKLKASKIEGA